MEISSVLIGQFWSRDLIKKKKKKIFLKCLLLILPMSCPVLASYSLFPLATLWLLYHLLSSFFPTIFLSLLYHVYFPSLITYLFRCLSVCLSVYLSTRLFTHLATVPARISLSHPSITSLFVLRPFDARARIRTCDLSHCSLMHYQLC